MSGSITTRNRHLRSTLRTATALIASGALLLSACGGDDDPESGGGKVDPAAPPTDQRVDGVLTRNIEEPGGTPSTGGSLAMGIEAETDGWNPVVNRWALSGHYVASAIFDTPVTLADDGGYDLSLAASLEHNDDATQWTLVLQDGIQFHDGTPLNAEVIVEGFKAHLGSFLTKHAFVLLDPEMTMPDGPEGLTVVFNMNTPWATFPYTLMGQAGYVIPPQMTRDLNTIRQPAGTGPFQFVEWNENESTIVARNENYWRDGLPHLDEITFYPIVDGNERESALANGTLDLMVTRTPEVIVRLMESDYRVVSDNDQEENLVLFNHAQAPFDDINARKAAVQSVDMDRFMDETNRDAVSEIARGPFAPGGIGYDEDDGYLGYDLDAAKAAVEAYRAEHGEPPTFEFITYPEVEYQQATQSLVAMWQEAGIEVTTNQMVQADSVTSIALGTYQAAMFRMFGNPNPDTEYTYWASSSIDPGGGVSLNWARFSHPVIDEQLLRSRATFDPDERHEAMSIVARTMNEEAGFLWLDRVNWALAANSRVHGLAASTNGTLGSLSVKPWLAELWVE